MASDHNYMKKIIFWPVNDMQLKTWFMQMSYNENDLVKKGYLQVKIWVILYLIMMLVSNVN